MKTSKLEKQFDCIAMKNDIQSKIYAIVKDMEFAELRSYMDKSLQNDGFWNRINAQKSSVLQ
jgi:hypothetical protein